LVHYPRLLERFGPLYRLSTMRCEGMHRPLKTIANVSANKINLTLTVLKKHQLKVCELFLKGEFEDPLQIVYSSEIFVPDVFQSSLANITCNKTDLRLIKKFSYQTTQFKVGSTVVLKASGKNDFPEFLVITNILLAVTDNVIIFIGDIFHTTCFDHHFGAYEVEKVPFGLSKTGPNANESLGIPPLRPPTGVASSSADPTLPFPCRVCDRSFGSKTGLGVHMRRAHPNEPKACSFNDLCSRVSAHFHGMNSGHYPIICG